MKTRTETARSRLVETYKFLLSQPPVFIANAWLLEYIEKRRALNFIRKKGLFVEFKDTLK